MMAKESKHIVRNDITSAYVDSLKKVVRNGYLFALMTEVERPLIGSIQVEDELARSGLNVDKEMHRRFEAFDFNGKTGKWWIENRIHELFSGLYHTAICKYDQLDFIRDALKKIETRKYTWCSNRLLCVTFDHTDEHTSHLHLSRQPIPPCLTLLDFKPEQRKLHLIASWRAQYFDTKAYGNLISLAMMLRNVCKNTGFQPGHVISIANKAILKNRTNARRLVKSLQS
ncbi:MAG: hypothetical protein OEW62_00925 [Candidatus Bathyarchaeota archaeon]|nr:hypothetical protein [Candidatus Bathyarchaeota archaeon]